MHKLTLLLGFIMAMFIAACGTVAVPLADSPVETPIVDTAMIERGIEVYRENYCGACHTLTAAGTRGTFGPVHDDAGTQAVAFIALESYTGEAINAADYIRESLLNPTAFYTPGYEATNHHMPAFTHLPEADVEALVYMLAHE